MMVTVPLLSRKPKLDGVEVPAGAAPHYRFAIASGGPSKAESRREIAASRRGRVQAALAQQRQQQRGLGEIVIEAARLIGPGQTPVQREARIEAPGIGRVETVKIGDAGFLKVGLGYIVRADACLKAAQGRYFWDKWQPETTWKALDYFQQAIAKDPSYALAHAGAAYSYQRLLSAGGPGVVIPDGSDKMKAAAEKALQIDPLLPEAYGVLGIYNTRRNAWVEAERNFLRARPTAAQSPGRACPDCREKHSGSCRYRDV
jgi:hypothetical protein